MTKQIVDLKKKKPLQNILLITQESYNEDTVQSYLLKTAYTSRE